jgi:2-oxoisovalerate dehydrogenase E1 component
MDPVGLFALFVGWRIVAPSNSFDYIGLFNTAMQSLDPVLILEHHTLYGKTFEVPKDNHDYFIPFGKARIVSPGSDVTVLTYSSMVGRVENLVSAFEERGVSPEVIDLRTVDPTSVDYETIGRSLAKTGTLAIVEQAARGQSVGCRIASNISERFFDYLDGPIAPVTSLDVPNSVSRVLEEAAMLSDDEILDTVTAVAKREWK